MTRACLAFLLCFPFLLRAQTPSLNNSLQFFLYDRTNKNAELDLLVYIKNAVLSEQPGLKIKYQVGELASISCSEEKLSELMQSGIVLRAELVPAHKQPLNDTLLFRNRIKAAKTGVAPLPQSYDGTGILMGIIDTGIDFSHPDFKDNQGKTRIRFLWDQTVNNLGSPQPYNYGKEWTAADIDANLCTHSDFPYYGHGTGVCGIAAGNAKATGKYEGVASESDLIVVALDFTKVGPTIADAVHYIASRATQIGKPFVINASLGDYYGSHDATDLEAKTIESMVKNIPGRVMIAAAGNAGDIPFHVRTQVNSGDTNFTWFKNNTLLLDHTLYGDLNQIQQIQFSIGANRGNYSSLGNIGFKTWNYALNTIKIDTLKHNNQRIGIVESAASVNPFGVYELAFRITADSSGLLWRIESTGAGLHDAWNFDLVTAPLPSPGQYPPVIHYAKPDTIMNIVSSFQCSDEILTVGNYVNMRNFYSVNGATVNTGETAGDLATESSKGPTRDQRQKPDITATGNNVIAPILLSIKAYMIQNQPQKVSDDSMHTQAGGTSAASPVAAGLAALYLQKNPGADNREILDAIRNCAYQDNYTGNQIPNEKWGFGKLDGFRALLCTDPVTQVSINSSIGENPGLRVFPNPFSRSFKVLTQLSLPATLNIFSPTGALLKTIWLTQNETAVEDCIELSTYHGLLLFQTQAEGKTYTFKVLKD